MIKSPTTLILPLLTKVHWVAYINIGVAFFFGLWIPVRIVFFQEPFALDLMVDLVAFLVIVAGRKERYATTRTRDSKLDLLFLVASDVLVALPIVSLMSIFTDINTINGIWLLKLLYLGRVLEIRSVLNNFDSLHPVLYRLLPVSLILPLVIHIVAVGWVWLGSGNAGHSETHFIEYAKAVYWAITTLCTVGYGDISPKTLPQMFYANGTMIVGVAFFGYVLSNVASLLARLDAAREEYLSSLDKVETFLGYNDLPVELRGKIRSYYRYLWDRGMGYDDSAVLSKLPQKLRAEVSLYLNAEMIEKVPILSTADRDCLENIVLELTPMVAVPNEIIFHAGEPGDAMYFIHRGQIDIITADGLVLATLPPGSFFGEMALLTNNPRNASARTSGFCDLYVLSRDSFERVLGRYPGFAKHVKEIAAERLGRNVTLPV